MNLLARRRAMMAASGGEGGLPSEYQQVEFIVNGQYNNVFYGGNAYLDLDISVTDDDIIECEVRTINGGKNLFGGRSSATLNNISFDNTSENHMQLDYGSYQDNRVITQLRNFSYNFSKITISKSAITIDNTTTALASTPSFATPAFYLFNTYNGYQTSPKYGLVKYFAVKDKAKLIPCYRKADGEIGMYDTIRRRFFTNAGTTAFGKGADVN